MGNIKALTCARGIKMMWLSCDIPSDVVSFLSIITTCQNFQFWQVCSFDGLLLAKVYNFGKYVRLSVCYLPKFTIFGKYVLLSVCYLPKFKILASMFVCRFVCLSVRFVKHNSWTLWHIITKLGPHMEWVSSSSMYHWQISRSRN